MWAPSTSAWAGIRIRRCTRCRWGRLIWFPCPVALGVCVEWGRPEVHFHGSCSLCFAMHFFILERNEYVSRPSKLPKHRHNR